jgi:hypothetical protein
MMSDDDKTIEAADVPLNSEWLAVKRAATDKAKAGDMYAAQVYVQMELIDINTARFELPPANDPAGLEQAQAAVIAAIKPHGLTPRAAMVYSTLLENRRRAMSTRNHEARLSAVEQVNRDRARSEWRRQ